MGTDESLLGHQMVPLELRKAQEGRTEEADCVKGASGWFHGVSSLRKARGWEHRSQKNPADLSRASRTVSGE